MVPLPVSFAHLINLEFFDDLLGVLQNLIQSGVSINFDTAPYSDLVRQNQPSHSDDVISAGSDQSGESPLHPDSLYHPVRTGSVCVCVFEPVSVSVQPESIKLFCCLY